MVQPNEQIQALIDQADTFATLSTEDFRRDYQTSVYITSAQWLFAVCITLFVLYMVTMFNTSDLRAGLVALSFLGASLLTCRPRWMIKKFRLKRSIRLFLIVGVFTIFVFSLFQAIQFVIIGTMGTLVVIILSTVLDTQRVTRYLILVSLVAYVGVVFAQMIFDIPPIDLGILLPIMQFGVPLAVIMIVGVTLTAMLRFFEQNLSHVEQQRQQLIAQSRALRSTAQELARSNYELENFAYVASHDLREPLRKIKAFSDRLQTMLDGKLNETEADYFKRLVNAGTRMQKLIDDLLAFSRVHTQAETYESVDLKQVITQLLDDIEVQITESKAKIIINDLPTITADKLQMRQLFQNLVSNAIKYRRADVAPQITITCINTQNNMTSIIVEDNGIGFDQQYAERIFGIFERLHGRTSYSGSGIGLAICRKIVEYHQGTIVAQGQPNNGARFIIQLPIEQS